MESSMQKFEFEDESRDEPVGHSNEKSLLYKMAKTIAIVLIWVCIGLWAEITGPTLPDLKYRTNSNYETISQAVSMRGAGNLAGSVLGGGFIVDRFHNKVELILAVCLVCCAGLNVAIPYSTPIAGLFVINVIEGWMEAIVNIAGQVVIMDIWKERASGPLHLIHLGFGAGGFLLPQIVVNFISDKLPKRKEDTSTPSCDQPIEIGMNNSVLNSSMETTTVDLSAVVSDNFQYGFLIVSAIILAIAGLWFFYAYYERNRVSEEKRTSHPTFKEIFSLHSCSPGHPLYALFLYILLFCWIFVAVAGERLFAKYLYSYVRSLCNPRFDKQEAANLLTAFWVSFTAGRFSGFVAANFLHMKYIIFIEGFGNLASALVLYFFGDNKYVLWACVCASGVLIGPCYPSGLSWANRYMIVTATGVTVLSIAAGISDISFLSTIGYFIENLGISVMTSFLVGFGVLISILPILMMTVACQRGDRFERDLNQSPSKN